jgi:hypothetical protein
MKNTLKMLLLVPLILAIAVAPIRADDTNDADTKTNAEAIAAPEPPTAPAPPEHPQSSHPVVGIDPSGIYIGSTNPMNIQLPRMQGMSEEEVGAGIVLITFISVVTPFLFTAIIVASLLFFRHRRNRIVHETLRAMIEKGVPIPPELLSPQGARMRIRLGSDLRNGLILLGIGAGLIFISHGRWSGTGLMVVFVGIAFLLTWFIERKEANKVETK